ncbi:MAG: competence/damage-inducible protein A, partial [Alphaproteobacteria bacterium]|nr:competence/damage-inducible protein A [Alphaproteobacteria bacterium]
MTQPSAAMLVIGDEILSGRTQDKNINTLAQFLHDRGIALAEVRVIGDTHDGIVAAVKALSAAYNLVFTSGGIGPTHDDITAKSVSKAFGIKYEVHKDAFKILEAYYQPGEFNEGRQKMAWMPENAKLILNPTSGAPGFNVENVFSL